jgi:hypothetical protein
LSSRGFMLSFLPWYRRGVHEGVWPDVVCVGEG